MFHQPDQSKPALDIIDDLLASATGPNNTLTTQDLSAVSSRRRRDARANNSSFTINTFQKLFGSSKSVVFPIFYPYKVNTLTNMICSSSTLLTIFGGRVDDLAILLKEERIPDDWESRVRDPWGLTFAAFNRTVFRVELGIDESKKYQQEAVIERKDKDGIEY